MAKYRMHPNGLGISGRVGDYVFREVAGGVVLARRPTPSSAPRSPSQIEQEQAFKLASAFASAVMADPVKRTRYQFAAGPGESARTVAIADYFRRPRVTIVPGYRGRVGDQVRVFAEDAIDATGVVVTLRGANQAVIESGPATFAYGLWVYTATVLVPPGQTVTIEAVATDLPGNVGEHSLNVQTA